MRAQVLAIVAASVLSSAILPSQTVGIGGSGDRAGIKRITWGATMPLHTRLEAHGITSAAFPSYVEGVRVAHARRIREGDLDHLVFYLLQSTRFTSLPAIEPALSAKELVASLPATEREAYLRNAQATPARVPTAVRSRVGELIRALNSSSRDPRLAYFRGLVKTTFRNRREWEPALVREYLRVMRFVYEKEFVAQRSAQGPAAVAALYRTRGLSTDTAVEAGYLVYLGLGVIRTLEPDRRVRRVLIVGPGLDLAPRTALLEAGPPESYQPWAVIDALLALGLSRPDDLDVMAADINPRVVDHLRRPRTGPPTLTLVSEIRESETVMFSKEYRDYFERLGHAIGEVETVLAPIDKAKGRLLKGIRVGPAAVRVLRADLLDVVTERLDAPAFDLIVATNVLPYFDDVELMLAMSNVACMLAPGGVFLHNEPRPLVLDLTAALRLPFEQSRHAIIATVRGAPAPLFDSVWLHRKVKDSR